LGKRTDAPESVWTLCNREEIGYEGKRTLAVQTKTELTWLLNNKYLKKKVRDLNEPLLNFMKNYMYLMTSSVV
jgi:hypothetical protein